jgi:DNA helicase-2/ATP-dependent DNA helicase PcrA
MQSLTLSHATSRNLYGETIYSRNSVFLDEIPSSFLNHIKNESDGNFYQEYKKSTNEGKSMASTSDSIYSIGQAVKHAKFGMGTVVNYEGSGDSMRVQINFQKAGTKWLITSYAKLETV